MKTLTAIFLIIGLLLSPQLFAADLTITINAAQLNKLQWAFGKQLNLQDVDLSDPDNPISTPRDATNAEIKQQMMQCITRVYNSQERRKRHQESDNNAAGF